MLAVLQHLLDITGSSTKEEGNNVVPQFWELLCNLYRVCFGSIAQTLPDLN